MIVSEGESPHRAERRPSARTASRRGALSADAGPTTLAGMADDVQLTDLEVIQRYSLAVRGATASRADLMSALQADLDWLKSGRRAAPAQGASAGPARSAAERAEVKPAASKAAPTKSAPTKSAPTKSAPTKSAPTKAAPAKSRPAGSGSRTTSAKAPAAKRSAKG
jgi:hypothetical protein